MYRITPLLDLARFERLLTVPLGHGHLKVGGSYPIAARPGRFKRSQRRAGK